MFETLKPLPPDAILGIMSNEDHRQFSEATAVREREWLIPCTIMLLPPFAGGALLGVLLAIKPQLFLFAPLAVLVRRDWQALMGMASGSALIIVASLVLLGPGIWMDWLAALPAFHDTLVRDAVLSRVVTPAGQAEALGYPLLPFLLTGAIVGGSAVAYAARKLDGAELIALIVASSIVASPYAHGRPDGESGSGLS